MFRSALLLVCAAGFAAGCTTPPHWSLPLAALDRVPLSVAAPTAHDVWIAGGALGSGGNALILHYDGSAWTRTDPGTDATLWWVDAPDASTRWFVGERGTVLRGDALAVESVPTTATLYGVWQSQAGTVWIVGGEPDLSGVILRRVAGGAWEDVTPAGTGAAFFKVWGASDDDVWICGQSGALVHWDGSALAPVALPSGVAKSTPLFTVAGSAPNDVYAVGGLGTAVALHFDGGTWSALGDAALSGIPGLTGVSVDADGSAILVGGSGTKLRGRPGAFVDESRLATREDLHGAAFIDGEVFTVGGSYLAPAPAPREGVVAHYGGDVPSVVR